MAPCACPLCAAFLKSMTKPARTRSARRTEREQLKKQLEALLSDDDSYEELMRYKACTYMTTVASMQITHVRDLQGLLAGEQRARTCLESALNLAMPPGHEDRMCLLCHVDHASVVANCGHFNFCSDCWTTRRDDILRGTTGWRNACLRCTAPNNWAQEYAELEEL